jgi:chromosome segregation ATPase
MNPEQKSTAETNAERARRLAAEIGTSRPVAKSAAELAAACFELASSGFAWSARHELVRDLGTIPSRESVLREAAEALRLASRSMSRLAIHGASGVRSQDVSERLRDLAKSIRQSTSQLDACERELAERIDQPRLAEIALENRRASLRTDPTPQILRIERLAKEVESMQAAADGLAAQVASLEDRKRRATDHAAGLESDRSRLAESIKRLESETRETETEIARLEHRKADLTQERARAHARLAAVRHELESLRDDPRDRIREAVRRALAEMPPDSFDRSVRRPDAP